MTVKNMRHNVTQQPKTSMVSKAVSVETLSWGSDIGGEKFSKALGSQFRVRNTGKMKSQKKQETCATDHNEPESLSTAAMESEDDPVLLVTHLIASDVLYGRTTLEPLSSVVAAFKLRNPKINVIILNKERSPESYPDMEELKSQIEAKVQHGLSGTSAGPEYPTSAHSELDGFSVSVRDVVHKDISNLKLVEC